MNSQPLDDMKYWKYLMVLSGAIFLRSTISLHSYSGYEKPPMFGDFEAQRHWQEITVNLPTKEWYTNTTDNDLQYWGLDYPPLTAYHSFVVGKVAQYLNSSYVQLHKSRGITTSEHKNFMRNTVILADFLIYIPAMFMACNIIFEKILKLKNKNNYKGFQFVNWSIALYYPGQILIDNGHFQYNNISLGLAVFAVVALIADRRLLGAFFFVLALNYKQMELYHAIPFFCYLLGNCFIDENNKKFTFSSGVMRLFELAIVVIPTFIIIWLPWLGSLTQLEEVVRRIFPIYRGIFEDKVSNVWCIVNVFMKIKDNFSNEEMAKICLICTTTAIIPSAMKLLVNPKKRQFLYALVVSSLAFFLFSFQVHEKSILVAAIPAILIFPLEPFMVFWFLQVSTFSMLPLLIKDGIFLAFIGISGATFMLVKIIIDATKDPKQKSMNFLRIFWNFGNEKKNDGKLIENLMVYSFLFSLCVEIILIISWFVVKPPEHLPFLHPLLISAFSCCHFIVFFVYFNVKQLFYE